MDRIPDIPSGARRRRDPEIERIYQIAGRGRVNPLGYTPVASGPVGAPHSPWLRLLFAVVLGLMAWGLFDRVVVGSLLVAVILCGLIWCFVAFLAFWSIRQMPSWYRARRMVRAYLLEHPGKFPKQLRWYA